MKAALAAAALALSPLPAAASGLDAYSDFYVFGDSVSGPGNLFDALFGAPVSPVPGKFPHAQATDGDVWAAQLGADFASGTNYAHISARAQPTGPITFTLPGIGSLDFDVPDLGAQITQYRSDAPTLGDNALAAVFAGSNDLRDAFSSTEPGAVIARALLSITFGVRRLLQDFDEIVVFGIPDLGLVPEVAALGPGASAVATAVSAQTNALLTATLDARFGDEVTFFDTFGFFQEVLADPASFGFTNVTEPCTDPFVPAPTAPDCSGFLFYDTLHPTEAGHVLLAQRFVQQASDHPPAIPLPAGGLLLIGGLGALVGLRRARKAAA